ncbi:MAG: hypothetical protein LAT57_14040, partial [Balneolales bacterium]|nr:hypothetical protein [Balneolales bacterium]
MKLNPRRRFFVIGAFAAVLFGCYLSFLPLIGDFSIETAQLLGIVGAICGLVWGIRELRHTSGRLSRRISEYQSRLASGDRSRLASGRLSRRTPEYQSQLDSGVRSRLASESSLGHTSEELPVDAIISTLFRTYCIIIVGLLLISIPVGVSAIIGGCLTFDGILFMVLIPPTSVFLGISIARFVSIAVPRSAYLVGFSALFILAALIPLFLLLFLPHVFLFNSIWGWFPGPIYDEVIT